MPRSTPPKRWLCLPALGCVLLAACGGGGESTSGEEGATAGVDGPTPASICARLPEAKIEKLISKAAGNPAPKLALKAAGTSKLVACRFTAPGVKLDVNLDTASRAARRYRNRVTEMAQFGSSPEIAPHPVDGVGDRQAGGGANWIPASDQLLAADGDQYLIVDFYVRNVRNGDLRDSAAALARLAFARLPSE